MPDGDALTAPGQPAPTDVSATGVVCGLDLSGFCRWVEASLERDGEAAVEAVADTLDAFFRRCMSALSAEGQDLRAFLGDGLLTSGPAAGAESLAAREARMVEALERAAPPGPLRLAIAEGAIWTARAGGWSGRWFDLISGPAVVKCHARLRDCSAISTPGLARAWATPLSTYTPGKLADAELADRIFLLARLAHPDAETAWRTFLWATSRVQAAADAANGVLEAVTHDDAGLMMRISFPNGGRGAGAADDLGRWVLELFRGAGADCGVGLAAGRVFRGSGDWGAGAIAVVQGASVNRAAKLAKGATGLHRDPSMPERSTVRTPLPMRPARTPEIGALEGLGRYADLRRLTADDAPPAEVHIEAGAGLGKSFLLRALEAEPRTRRAVLVAAEPRHGADALWLAARLVEALRTVSPRVCDTLAAAPRAKAEALDRRLSPAQRGGGEADVHLASELILEALAALPYDPTQLILIDDLQWADLASLALLRRILDERPRIHLVTTRRDDGSGSQHPLGRTVRLAPLGAPAMRRALEQAGAAMDSAASAEIHRLSGGAPLLGLQLAFHAREAGQLTGVDLGGVLEHRLARVAPAERATLRVLALADRRLAPERVARLSGAGASEIGAALIALADRRLVEGGAGGFSVIHRAIADHVAAGLPASVRSALHRRLARGLGSGGEAAGGGEIGDHYLAGGEALRGAIRHLRDAEAALHAGAYAAALDLFDRAAPHLGAGTTADVRRGRIAAGRALAAWGMGKVETAHGHARQALDHVDAILGDGRVGRGRRRRRVAVLAGRAAVLPRHIRTVVLHASVARTETSLFRGDLAGMAAANLACARVPGEGRVQAVARARGLSTVGLLFGLARLGGLAELAYSRGQSLSQGSDQAYVIASQAVWRLAFGRWTEARTELVRAEALLGEAANPHLREALITLDALCAQMEGRLDHAEAAFRRLEAAARLRGNDLHVAWGLYGRAMPLLHGGRAEEAADLADLAYDLLGGAGDLQSELNALGLAAQAHARTGRAELALARARRGVETARSASPLNFGTLEGYAGPAAAAAAVATDPNASNALRSSAKALLPEALRGLDRFTRVFPIGRPRLLAVRSLAAEGAAAERLAARAAGEARRFGMAMEHWDHGWFDPRRRR